MKEDDGDKITTNLTCEWGVYMTGGAYADIPVARFCFHDQATSWAQRSYREGFATVRRIEPEPDDEMAVQLAASAIAELVKKALRVDERLRALEGAMQIQPSVPSIKIRNATTYQRTKE